MPGPIESSLPPLPTLPPNPSPQAKAQLTQVQWERRRALGRLVFDAPTPRSWTSAEGVFFVVTEKMLRADGGFTHFVVTAEYMGEPLPWGNEFNDNPVELLDPQYTVKRNGAVEENIAEGIREQLERTVLDAARSRGWQPR